jgi:hypothetical protein
LIATGHYSEEFKSFLLRHFSSVDIDFCFDGIAELRRDQSLKDVKAFCRPDKTEIFRAIQIEIQQNCEDRPVIVFGMNDKSKFIQELKSVVKTTVFVVTDSTTLQIARNYFQGKKSGVVFMSDEYRIGVDIKCGTDGHVLVYVPKGAPWPDREQVTQSVGRGNRSRGDY